MFDSWEFIQDYVGYGYFKKVVNEDGIAEKFFCGDELRLYMI